MKILYVIPPYIINKNNGIKKQAEIWAQGLENNGNKVLLYNPWETNLDKSIDLIHIFGNGLWLVETIKIFKHSNKPIILSPIIDSYKSTFLYKLASYIGLANLRIFSTNYVIRYLKKDINLFLVRSNHEKKYLNKSYNISKNKIELLRLPSRFKPNSSNINLNKENFCLHVSIYTDDRKNVTRLIKAAIKYKFNLIIAGTNNDENKHIELNELIKNHSNIKIIGSLEEKDLIELYRKAKVFALPSINEGVGFVALEAAMYGCNVVITKIGAPKEYYNNYALTVNPFDVDDIGKKIVRALEAPLNNSLTQFIQENYNIDNNIYRLQQIYNQVIKKYKY